MLNNLLNSFTTPCMLVDGPISQPTQSGERVSQGLSGVRRVARERKQERFTALLHHVTVDLLRESFDALKKNALLGWMA